MNQRILASSFLLPALLACLGAPAARAESVSPAAYRAQLHRIEEKVAALEGHPGGAAVLVTEIPDHVAVAAASGEIEVSFKALRNDLAAYARSDESKRPGQLEKIQRYVQSLETAAERYEHAGADPAAARGKLNQILAGREFQKVKPPGVLDALAGRVYRWLGRILNKLSFGAGSTFDWMQLLIYLLVGAAACLLLIWTIRRFRRPKDDLPPREIVPFSPSARSWRAWLAEARALAEQKDWRNAIHLAYWAGICYLEQHGAWKPNRARTPREYLRLIGARTANYPVLVALTRKLELVWYGYGTAIESDFQETLVQLEKLGCR
ncbi:MAG TPA: hypothetical protein VFT65_06410 [Candidatus Angelobacter sp.]|nr:hypothetical protein [Candidatus Angelobacter sp.]